MKKLATKALIVVVCVVCACSHAPAQEAKPDTVLLNGKIFTGAASRPYVQAVAILGDRIMATGDMKTIQAMVGPKTNAIDLHGATAIPGINDAHHHFQLGPPEVDVDLHAMNPSWAQVKDGIVAAIAKNPPGSLISVSIGFRVFGDPSIDRDALDQIAPNNPVSLGTFTGHGMILNTAGLRFYNISQNQPDPLGGRFERDAKGRLTGTLREYAIMNIERAAADRVPESAAIAQLRQQLDEEAKYGVTSIQELSFSMAPSRAVSLLAAIPTQIRIRVVRMPGTTAAGRDIDEGKGVPAHPASLITVSGSKWLADGVGVEGTFTPRGEWKLPANPPFDSLVTDLPLEFPRAGIPGHAAGISQEQRTVTASCLRQSVGRDDPRCRRRFGRKKRMEWPPAAL